MYEEENLEDWCYNCDNPIRCCTCGCYDILPNGGDNVQTIWKETPIDWEMLED